MRCPCRLFCVAREKAVASFTACCRRQEATQSIGSLEALLSGWLEIISSRADELYPRGTECAQQFVYPREVVTLRTVRANVARVSVSTLASSEQTPMSSQPIADVRLQRLPPLEAASHHHLGQRADDSHRKPRFASANGAIRESNCRVLPDRNWYLPIKRLLDTLLALVLLVVTSPAIVIGAILVRWTSRGPAFYCQVRAGKDGRPFTIVKLRTMVENAEAGTGAVWCSHNDPRITPLGHLLRTTHIDEFPQLVNVILGQMSLVGPRPERPEFVDKLEWEIPHYRERLRVRPGITGLAQVRLPPDTNIDSVCRKLVHDLYYIKHASPWLDLQLLSATGWTLLRVIFRQVFGWLDLPSQPVIETEFSTFVGVSQPAKI